MKIAIIGGGASGLCSAISAARKAEINKIKADITVFETNQRAGKKLLATGNGRCNMMNMNENVKYFGDVSFAESVLKRYGAKSNLRFFASLGLYTRADEEGRVYPLSNQASSVLDALRFECERLGIKIFTEREITEIEKNQNGFTLNSNMNFDKAVLACGSPAGVKSFCGYELLKSLGHTVTKTAPALSKLEVKNKQLVKSLKGVRHKVKISLFIDNKLKAQEDGEVLFTDYGLSGIAVMQLSSYISRHFMKSKTCPAVSIDLVSSIDEVYFKKLLFDIVQRNKNGKAENLLTGFMPKKIGEAILKECKIPFDKTYGEITESEIEKIISISKAWCFEIAGVKGYADCQVTAGGALCSEFSNKTLESKICKGLYCCGEILDIDGLCGGYNLQWAWSSGRLCGESLIGG